MRRCRGEKIVNVNNWCVNGSKIRLHEPSKAGKPGKTIRFRLLHGAELEEEESRGGRSEEPIIETNLTANLSTKSKSRSTLRLNVSDCDSSKVSNRRLRRIYETVEVEDFERILRDVYVNGALRLKTDDEIDCIDADEIYEEFFGQFYDFLGSSG